MGRCLPATAQPCGCLVQSPRCSHPHRVLLMRAWPRSSCPGCIRWVYADPRTGGRWGTIDTTQVSGSPWLALHGMRQCGFLHRDSTGRHAGGGMTRKPGCRKAPPPIMPACQATPMAQQLCGDACGGNGPGSETFPLVPAVPCVCSTGLGCRCFGRCQCFDARRLLGEGRLGRGTTMRCVDRKTCRCGVGVAGWRG